MKVRLVLDVECGDVGDVAEFAREFPFEVEKAVLGTHCGVHRVEAAVEWAVDVDRRPGRCKPR